MHLHRRLAPAASAALAVAFAAAPASSAAAPPPAAGTVVISLEAPAAADVGGEIALKVTLANEGDAELVVRQPAFDAKSIDFDVAFGSGKPSRYTRYPSDPRIHSSSLPGVDLKAGATLSFEHAVPAVKAGTWTFAPVFRGRDGSDTVVTGDPVKVEVKAKDGAEQMLWRIETAKGTMTAQFWPEVAPATTLHIAALAKRGFYDGTIFHRTIRDFMIQGGDPTGTGGGGPGFWQQAEFNDRKHLKGTLSMARVGGRPNSAGSQFFVVHSAHAANLDREYTAFGKLVDGLDVLDAIATAPATMGMDGAPSVPKEPVKITKASLVTEGAGS